MQTNGWTVGNFDIQPTSGAYPTSDINPLTPELNPSAQR
jgi:hypothetical protein